MLWAIWLYFNAVIFKKRRCPSMVSDP